MMMVVVLENREYVIIYLYVSEVNVILEVRIIRKRDNILLS